MMGDDWKPSSYLRSKTHMSLSRHCAMLILLVIQLVRTEGRGLGTGRALFCVRKVSKSLSSYPMLFQQSLEPRVIDIEQPGRRCLPAVSGLKGGADSFFLGLAQRGNLFLAGVA